MRDKIPEWRFPPAALVLGVALWCVFFILAIASSCYVQ